MKKNSGAPELPWWVHVLALVAILAFWALGVYVKAWLFGKGAGLQ